MKSLSLTSMIVAVCMATMCASPAMAHCGSGPLWGAICSEQLIDLSAKERSAEQSKAVHFSTYLLTVDSGSAIEALRQALPGYSEQSEVTRLSDQLYLVKLRTGLSDSDVRYVIDIGLAPEFAHWRLHSLTEFESDQ